MAGGISIHVIDVTRAVPATGMAVQVFSLGPERRLLAAGALTVTGTLEHPMVHGDGVTAGIYEAEFQIGDYYRAQGFALPNPAFLDTTVFRFGVADANAHYHLPLKMTPWGFSLFRGGA
jgi:5-hydroxyisourate hydrolase